MKSHEGPESKLEKAPCPIAEHCDYSVCVYCVHENQKYRGKLCEFKSAVKAIETIPSAAQTYALGLRLFCLFN